MSIVERALNPQSKSSRRPTEPVPGAEQAFAVVRARESITLDVEALRRYGVLPYDEEEALRRDDEFRRVKWPIVASAFGSESEQVPDGDLVLVTSSVPGEGKTYVSINLALSIARERNCGVLLLDGDLERRQLSTVLGVGDRRGLTDLLSESRMVPEQVILGTDVPRLSILPAGPRVSNAPELLSGDGLQKLVRWFSATCTGYVLLMDSPPLLARTEAQVLARTAGQVVFVVGADSTLRATVRDALALLPGGPLVRCLLNKTQRSSLAGYYGGYENYALGPR